MKKLPLKDIKSNPDTYITDPGVLTVNTDTFVVSVHNGVTPGGIPINAGNASIAGTPGEIAVNAVPGLTTVSIADNVSLPGTESMRLPGGTSAQRSSTPENGDLRFNETINLLEIYNESLDTWASIRTGVQSILFPPSVIFVTLTPSQNPHQFTSISAALASITDNSPSKLYVIFVEPGVYVEPQLVMKPYVTIMSRAGAIVTSIVPQNPSADFIIASNFSTLEGFSVAGVTGGTGLKFVSTSPVPSGAFRTSNMRFTQNKVDFHVHATDTDAFVVCSGLLFVTNSNSTETHFIIESDGTNNAGVLGRDLQSVYISGNNISETIRTTGPLSSLTCDGIQLTTLTSNSPGDGIVAQNGTNLNVTSGTISGFKRNIVAPNVGAAPTITIYGDISKNSTDYSLYIDHPGTTGMFVGASDFTKTYIAPTSTFVASYTDLTNKGQVTVGNMYVGHTQETLTNITPLIAQTPPTGVLAGGVITRGVGVLDIEVSGGNGYLSIDIGPETAIKQVTWPTTVLTLANNQEHFMYVNNNNTVIASPAPLDPTAFVSLGRVRTTSGYIAFISQTPYDANHTPTELDTFVRNAIGPIYTSGSIVTENETTPFALNVTPGRFYYSTKLFSLVGGTPITMAAFYAIGSSYQRLTGVTTVDHENYNDTAIGLVPMTAGYYTKHILYAGGEGANETYGLLYGTEEYSSLLEVQDAPLTSPPPFFLDDIVPIAAIIVQQGAPNIIVPIFDIRPRIGFQSPQATASNIHGNLIGLSANDHPQYLLASGVSPMLGNLNMGANNITNVNLVDGVDVSTHASRHLPNGADAITTAAPSSALTPSSTNAVGIANSLARSDHSHQITGFQPLDSDLTALANTSTTGLYAITASGTSTTRTLTGTASRISVTNGSGVSGNPTVDIDAGYVGQLSITTLGTISTGTWNATTIGIAKGGTNLTTLGTANQILGVNNGATGLEYKSLVQGPGIVIANGVNSVTLSTTGVKQSFSGTIGEISGTTDIPVDNTVPLVTEGTQVFSQTITPTSTSSKITIDFTTMASVSNNNRVVTLALFRGNTFICARAQSFVSAGDGLTHQIRFTDTPGTTSPVTYSVRVGISQAGQSWYLGYTPTYNFGGTNPSTWLVFEI